MTIYREKVLTEDDLTWYITNPDSGDYVNVDSITWEIDMVTEDEDEEEDPESVVTATDGVSYDTGKYYADWTVPADADLADYRITWRWKLNSGSVEQTGSEDFEITEASSGKVAPVDIVDTIAADIVIMSPEMLDFAQNILDKIIKNIPETTLTTLDIVKRFVRKSKNEKPHQDTAYLGDKYNDCVALIAGHFLLMAQPDSGVINTGIIASKKTDSQNGTIINFLPEDHSKGPYSTTKYGIEWHQTVTALGPEVTVESI